jgi:hypothetical protein
VCPAKATHRRTETENAVKTAPPFAAVTTQHIPSPLGNPKGFLTIEQLQTMKTVKAEGGQAVSLRLDGASMARVRYLEMYFRHLGVKASASALVRRALNVLTDEVSALVLRERKNGPDDGRVVLAEMRITWDARDNPTPAPLRNGLPALNNAEQWPSFPTFKELLAPGALTRDKHAAPAPIPPPAFISDEVTDETKE